MNCINSYTDMFTRFSIGLIHSSASILNEADGADKLFLSLVFVYFKSINMDNYISFNCYLFTLHTNIFITRQTSDSESC